jgi:hypothetical protein
MLDRSVVESAWGAVPVLLPVRFPVSLAGPGVRLSSTGLSTVSPVRFGFAQGWESGRGYDVALPCIRP